MINTYLQNPQHYLTQTACRRNLAGDVGAILRVHQFLEHWGLINYHVSPDTGGFIPIPPPAAQYQQNPMQALFSLHKQDEKPVKQQVNLTLRHNLFGQTQPTPSTAQHHCSNCGKDCSKSRYFCQKLAADKRELCPFCFAEGCYPDSVSSTDFVRADDVSSSQQQLDQWTDQETLLLLEGLELYNDNWAQVADHVATKSKVRANPRPIRLIISQEQCLLHFLRLPIEDPYAEEHISKIGKNGVSLATEAQLDEKLPFSESSNPVMAIIAFLSSAVSPTVAAAAASSALQIIMGKEGPTTGEADKIFKTEEPEKAGESGSDVATNDANEKAAVTKQTIQAAAAAAVAAAAVKAEV